MESVFVYTREAHPGEARGAHRSPSDKLGAARDMVAQWTMSRRMLVDDLEGTVHRAYGCLPNMTYVVARRGTVAYRASWTDARTVELALDQLAMERDERREGHRLLPYYAEWQPAKIANRAPFLRGLLENGGPRAVEEFIEAIAGGVSEGEAEPMRKWWAKHRPGGVT